jgi:hypothetical protein
MVCAMFCRVGDTRKIGVVLLHCMHDVCAGLAIRVKLLRSLPPKFKVDVKIRPGTHASELAVNKQVR